MEGIDNILNSRTGKSPSRKEIDVLRQYVAQIESSQTTNESERKRLNAVKKILKSLHESKSISERVQYTDADVEDFITGKLTGDSRQEFVEELKKNSTLRKNCIHRRERLSELEITISAEAARAFNSGLSALYSGNRNFPGHQYNDYGARANESVFIEDRERFYASARNSFEKLLELHELEDLALANLAIVEENVKMHLLLHNFILQVDTTVSIAWYSKFKKVKLALRKQSLVNLPHHLLIKKNKDHHLG